MEKDTQSGLRPFVSNGKPTREIVGTYQPPEIGPIQGLPLSSSASGPKPDLTAPAPNYTPPRTDSRPGRGDANHPPDFAARPGESGAETGERRVREVYQRVEENGGLPADRNTPRSVRRR